MPCPPDTDTKRLNRFYLFQRIYRLWRIERPDGAALVLAGSEASEIGLLRYYLEIPAGQTFFVDHDDGAGLKVVKDVWPEAQTYHGKIAGAIKSIRGDIAFLNLDFCGALNQEALDSVSAAAKRVAVYGIVSYTFARGRENAGSPHWQSIQTEAERVLVKDPKYQNMDRTSTEWLEAVRFTGHTEVLRQSLGNSFVPVYAMRYKGVSPMGVLAFQNVPANKRGPAWRKETEAVRTQAEKVGAISESGARDQLRHIAMKLTDGLTPKEVAEVLHLPKGTLAAWQAHKTRGTY